MGRYTLTMETYDNQTVDVCLKEASKMTSKVSLKTIDKFTTDVANQQDLLKRLETKLNVKNIDITYLYNKAIKTTPIAYGDKKDLTRLNMITDSVIDTNNSIFNHHMYKLLELLEEKKFFSYAMCSDLLTLKQKEYIEMRIYYGVYTKFIEDKLKSHSSTYHQFRNILFLMEEYMLLKQRQNITEAASVGDEEDERDPDEENLYSDEEKRQYQEYMENLPDEYYDDRDIEEDYGRQKTKRV